MVRIQSIEWFQCSIPLHHPVRLPAATVLERKPLLARITDADGIAGWGEASPLEGFCGWKNNGELIREALQTAKALSGEAYSPGALESYSPSIAFALSSAVAWIERSRSGLSTGIQLQLVSLLRNASEERDVASGVVKVKVGGDVAQDISFFTSVAEDLPDATIRLDANRRWSSDEAAEFLKEIETKRVDYFEEPCRDWRDFQGLGKRAGVEVAVDESLQEAVARNSGEETEILEQIDAAILKPTMIGSIERCHRLAEQAKNSGCRVVLSSAYETGVGMLGILDLSRRLGADQEPAGLGTYRMLSADILTPPLVMDGLIRLDDVFKGRAVSEGQLIRVE